MGVREVAIVSQRFLDAVQSLPGPSDLAIGLAEEQPRHSRVWRVEDGHAQGIDRIPGAPVFEGQLRLLVVVVEPRVVVGDPFASEDVREGLGRGCRERLGHRLGARLGGIDEARVAQVQQCGLIER